MQPRATGLSISFRTAHHPRWIAATCLLSIGLSVQAQVPQPVESQRPVFALVSALGSQIQMVVRSGPGATPLSFQRRLAIESDNSLDLAAVRGLRTAVATTAPESQTVGYGMAIPLTTLWRWHGSQDSPLYNVLDQIGPVVQRDRWEEVLIVTPALANQATGVSPVRRGAGVFADVPYTGNEGAVPSAPQPPSGPDRSTGIDKQKQRSESPSPSAAVALSVHLYAKVWRVDTKSLEVLGSEIVSISEVVADAAPEAYQRSLKFNLDPAMLLRLRALTEANVAKAASRLMAVGRPDPQIASGEASKPGPVRRGNRSDAGQDLPRVEVVGRRVACPELQWRYVDAVAAAHEFRHLTRGLHRRTQLDEALMVAYDIGIAALRSDCLVSVWSRCDLLSEDLAKVTADSGDSWRDRDIFEDIQARGVTLAFIERHFGFPGHQTTASCSQQLRDAAVSDAVKDAEALPATYSPESIRP